MSQSKRLRWYWKALAGLFTLLVLVVFLAPLLIPTRTLKHEIIRTIHTETGLILKIQGPVEVTVFPTLGLSLNRLTLMNPEGFPSKPLLEIHHASIEAALLPLLTGTIRVSQTTLTGVHLRVYTNRAGLSNVSRLLPASTHPTPQARNAAGHSTSPLRLASLGRLDLQQVDIRYENLQSGVRERIRGLDVTAGPIERFHPFPLSLRMQVHSRKPKLVLAIRLRTAALWGRGETFELQHLHLHVASQGPHPLKLAAQAKSLELAPSREYLDLSGLVLSGAGLHGSASVRGTLAPAHARDLEGHAAVRLTHLKPWFGAAVTHLVRPHKSHLPLLLDTRFHWTGEQVAMTTLAATLGSEKITGQMDVTLGTPRPRIQASFVGNELELTPATRTGSAAPRARAAANTASAAKPASSTSSLKALRAVDGEVALRLGALHYGAYTLTGLQARIRLNHGILVLNPAHAQGFGGTLALNGTLTAPRRGAPTVHLAFQAQNLSLHALSQAMQLGHPDALAGQLSSAGQTSFTGLSVPAVGQTLAGGGTLTVRHAVWQGVDLRHVLTAVGQALQGHIPRQWPSGGETRIGKLTARYALHHAEVRLVAATLTLVGLHATGSGTVNWVHPHVDLRLLLHPIYGTGPGQIPWPPALRGIAIPVTIQGAPTAPSVTPDLRSIVRGAVQSKLHALVHHLFGHLIPH